MTRGVLIGAGFEYAFFDNWTAKFEYNYIDYGERQVTFTTVECTGGVCATTGAFSENHKERKQIAKLGLKSKIYSFARAMNVDIDKAEECGCHGVIIEIPIGYPKLKYQFKWTAEDVLRKAIAANPSFLPTYSMLAQIYLAQKKTADAQREFDLDAAVAIVVFILVVDAVGRGPIVDEPVAVIVERIAGLRRPGVHGGVAVVAKPWGKNVSLYANYVQGLTKGDTLSIIGDNRPEWLFAELSAQSVGAIGIGIYQDAILKEVSYIINLAESKFSCIAN